ncbi:MAG TPA: SRPBCC family protein [Edaphobacter sp.]|nr:SRPBCC family protein [Edaphobacter sp.]
MLAKGTAEVTVTLPSETEIRFTRFFNRPRQLLFEAWTQPEHIRHWWGCDDASISVCEIDLRVGGSWKIVMRMSDGGYHPFHGVYREIALGKRLAYSECYDVPQIGSPEWLTTVTFEEIEGGTRLTHTIRHRSRQARDGHLQSGMEAGAIQSLHRLDERVARMLEGGVQS